MTQNSDVLSVLVHLSLALPLVLLPGLSYYVFDAAGWRSLLFRVPPNHTFFQALRIHVSSEAMVKTIPLGVALADSIRVVLLKRECNIPMTDGLSNSLYRRLYLGLAQGVYLIVGGLMGFSLLRVTPTAVVPAGYMGWIPLGAGILLVVVLLLVLILLSTPGARLRGIRMSKRIPWPTISARLIRLMERPIEAGPHFHRLFNRSTGMALIWFLAYWCAEAAETMTFMALLGIPFSIHQVAAIESVVSALRLAAFFLPSGIGVQEIGYAVLMASAGCVPAPGDASGFVILKRTKDIFWTTLGYTFLLAKGIRPFRKSTLVQAS